MHDALPVQIPKRRCPSIACSLRAARCQVCALCSVLCARARAWFGAKICVYVTPPPDILLLSDGGTLVVVEREVGAVVESLIRRVERSVSPDPPHAWSGLRRLTCALRITCHAQQCTI